MTVIMLYVGEFALRLLRQDPGFAAIEAADRSGKPWDRRSRVEVVEGLRARGIDAVSRAIPAALLSESADGTYHSRISIEGREVLPFAGISHKTVVLCNETGEYAIYESDEHGFRNPLGLWRKAPVDLVLIGDSFTLGECVPSEQALGDRLRQTYPATVNLGMGGHAPLFELGTLEEYGRVLRPRRVVWFYFENDLWWFDLGINKRTPLLMRYLEPGFRQDLLHMQPQIDDRLAELWATGLRDPVMNPIDRLAELRGTRADRILSVVTLSKLRDAVRVFIHPPISPAEREAPDLALFSAILEQARDRTLSWGGEFYFVYLPGSWNFGRGSGWRPSDDRVRNSVLEIARSLDLSVIDVQLAMEQHDDPLALYSYRGTSALGPPHFNGEGYAFVARVVLERLGIRDVEAVRTR